MIKYFLIAVFFIELSSFDNVSAGKNGKPWHNKMQVIPGRIECELYDEGGEGVAYHDADTLNNGSGKLNPANGNFLNEFRMREGVDISYTKSNNIDNNPYNKVMPELNQLYLGWTQPGEWVNYTVDIRQTALYQMGVMYTSNAGGAISVDIDNKPATGSLKINTTYDARDTVAWRQWHHWNKEDSLTSIKIKRGTHLLTLHIVENGNMNFDYIEFTKH